ncbi:MAG: cytochrome c oxidase subunit II [Gemmatimonadaceae bacterium]
MMLAPLIFAQTRLDTHVPSYMTPSGAPAGNEATLGWALTIIAVAVTVIVGILVLVAVLRERKDPDGLQPNGASNSPRVQIVSGLSWIYGGLAITVVILLGAFAATAVSLSHTTRPPSPPAITLDVTAHQWWWEVRVEDSVPSDAFVTANEIHVPVGVPVRVRVQSQDVIHSFWVPELFGKMDVIPGQINETWLRVDKPGTYRGACAEYCGLQHAHMAFAITAEPRDAYNRWAAEQRATSAGALPPNAALPPTAPRGETIFVASCGACHTVRGSNALGRIGPDLTHIASRQTIGAGLADNTQANMMRWVADAQSMKAGVLMPRMDLRHDDVAAVVAYLATLH